MFKVLRIQGTKELVVGSFIKHSEAIANCVSRSKNELFDKIYTYRVQPSDKSGSVISKDSKPILMLYVNWKKETKEYLIAPNRVVFKISQWHGKEAQWIMECLDIEKGRVSDFLMTDIISMRDQDDLGQV